MKQYLHMAFFTRLFGRSGDAVLDKIHKELVLSMKGDESKSIRPEGTDFPLDHLKTIIKNRTHAEYGLHLQFFADDADLMLNIVQGGVLQIDPRDPKMHPKDLKLEVDHIFPRSKLEKAGMGDIADHLGNYRLVVLPINRRKLANWPDANTDFSGKDDAVIGPAYTNAHSNFDRDSYWAFSSARATFIQGQVETFLGLKVTPKRTKGS